MKKQLLILMTFCISVIGYAQTVGDTFSDNSITYQITSLTPNEVETIGYVISGGPVVNVPASIINSGNAYTVTSIGTQTFASKNLTSVTLPISLINIADTAFTNNALTTITIPNSVVNIGYAAFGVNNLTSVIIPDNVTSLGDSAFDSNALTSVTISNGLSSLGLATFANNNLSAITIPSNISAIDANVFSNNPLTCVISEGTTPPIIESTPTTDSFGNRNNINLTIPSGSVSAYTTATWTGFNSVAEGLTGAFVVDNITYQIISGANNTVKTSNYNMSGGTVVNIPATVSRACVAYSVTEISGTTFSTTDITSVTIPTSVTIIGPTAFANNTNLINAPLHNGITNIGSNAFNNCGLTSVNIPTSITAIEDGTFANNDIASVIIPNNIISIGVGAFNNNPNLVSAQLHNGITSIGQSAFNGGDLNSINIPTSMTTLENFTFAFNNITSVIIPDNITSIGNSVFASNDITNLSLSNNLISIGNQAFVSNQLTSVAIPTSVTTIGSATFRSNQLTSVTIPVNVTTIGAGAFNFNLLTDVFSEATTPPTISTTGDSMDTFSQNRSTIHLHIPAGTTGTYVTDAGALWTGFNPVTEDALSIEDFELADAIKIITTTDTINIVAPNHLNIEEYALYSMTGTKIVTGTNYEFGTTSFSNGVYILKLAFDKGIVTKKVIIK